MMTSRRLKSIFSSILISFLISGLVLQGILPTFSHAASTITSDGTMGTTVAQSGKIYNIGGGTIRGTNQFQSFGLFSVGTGDTASFNGPVGIANIIGRVTGGQQSMIDGILKSTISGANLYLLNPYGVLFGKNASLSVSGSFHISTADYLKLSDGGMFYSNPLSSSVLTTAPPLAFGFLSNTPAAITIQESFLQVPRYKTLSVIGGDINITGGPSGYLYAPSGRINLASVKSSGEVVPNVGGAPDLGVESFSQLGAINLSNLAYVSVESSAGNGTIVIRGGRISVDNSYIIANTLGSANGASVGIDIKVREDFTANNGFIQAGTSRAGRSGDVLVTAGSLDMKNLSTIEAITLGAGNCGNVKVDTGNLSMLEGSEIGTNIWSSGNGGSVTITAEKIFLSGANDVSQRTALYALTNDYSTGHGGDVRLTTGRLEVRDGAQIDTSVWGYGNGGVVEVNAESVLLTGRNALNAVPAGIFSRPYAFGNAGGVRLKTGSLEVRDGAQISTSVYGLGKGGDLEVTAGSILLTPVKESGVNSGLSTGLFARGLYGDGGNIRIKTGSLEVMDGASISSSSKSKGAGGNIEVTADFISLSGVNQYGNRSGIYSQSDGQSAIGAAGDVWITTGSLEVKDGAEITVAALGPGNAGNLEVNAQSVLITGISPSGLSSRLSSNTYTSAKGGNIQITTDNLEVKDGAHIENTAFSSGNGGTIEVTAERVLVSGVSEGKAARITSQVIPGSSGKGGDVQITTNTLEVKDGGEIAISTWGSGNSGALSIAAKNITLDGGSHPELGVGLYASTYGAGNAGMIQINTKTLEMKGGAQIGSTTEGSGNSGSIEINADHVALSGVTDTKIRTGIFCATASSGRGGDIKITAGGVDVSDGADIDSGASGSGDAGRIIITAGSLNLSNGAFINGSTIDKGTGGDIDINGGLVQLINNASISADSSGTGNAGNININTWSLLMRNSSIITEAKQADGGNINIHAGYMVKLIDSKISASVGGGPDTVGGNITIDPEYVILNDSQIIANAYEGKGGNIRIIADVFLASPDSIVDASSALGIDGTVDIQAPISSISGTLAPMQGNFLSTEALLRDRCIARIRGERISSFVVSGRDGLPIRPGNVLPSPIY